MITITHPADADQRLDKFLKKYFREAPLAMIYKMIRTGKIKVNKKKQPQTYRLLEGDEIYVYVSDADILNMQTQVVAAPEVPRIKPKLNIIYQEKGVLIINKSPKINVHPGDHKSTEVSVIELVQDFLGKKHASLTFKPSLVHRIDRDTSGCLAVALEKNVLESLLGQIRDRSMNKIYHAIVLGKMPKPRGTIDDRILRIDDAQDQAKVRIDPLGQSATTHYRTLREWVRDGQTYSLLECQIETGRTHQIRVHLSHYNCPIIGDVSYGDRGVNRRLKRECGIDRQLLHAFSLEFWHPVIQERITVTAPYPEDFTSFLPQ